MCETVMAEEDVLSDALKVDMVACPILRKNIQAQESGLIENS